MNYNIAVISGDGIGPEITKEAIQVLEAVGKKFDHTFTFSHYKIGGLAYDEFGTPLPNETLNGCKNADAILLGAVGGPKWDNLQGDLRPEGGLLKIRKELGLYCNLRPAILYDVLKDASPLKPEIIGEGLDIMVVRELTGGIYFGEKKTCGRCSLRYRKI